MYLRKSGYLFIAPIGGRRAVKPLSFWILSWHDICVRQHSSSLRVKCSLRSITNLAYLSRFSHADSLRLFWGCGCPLFNEHLICCRNTVLWPIVWKTILFIIIPPLMSISILKSRQSYAGYKLWNFRYCRVRTWHYNRLNLWTVPTLLHLICNSRDSCIATILCNLLNKWNDRYRCNCHTTFSFASPWGFE